MYELWPPTKKRPNGERPHGEVVPETAHTQRERGEKETGTVLAILVF